MKRFLSVFLSTLICLSIFGIIPAAGENALTKTKDILVRDPFILVYEGKYYMYGTGLVGNGYGCRVSDDLENWGEPVTVWSKPAGHPGDTNWWAPECHRYKGDFYLFATYHDSVLGHRGVAIFRASSPLGPFEQISDGFITPDDTDSIDGTLYVAPDGQPYMVYVQEWTAQPDGIGKMAVARLSDDLTHFISEPVTLFAASDGKKGMDGGITDGPFVYTRKNGKLLMLWSNYGENGYAVGVAAAPRIDGRWRQKNLLYTSELAPTGLDGGHGMIFTDLKGRLMLAIHSPNTADEKMFEHAEFLEIVETDSTLMLKTEYQKLQSKAKTVSAVAAAIARLISALWSFIISIF